MTHTHDAPAHGQPLLSTAPADSVAPADPGETTDTRPPEAPRSKRRTSLLVNGHVPARPGLVALLAALGGALLSYAWSSKLVDREIGFNVADTLLGRSADATPIGGVLSGVVFAFVTGLAGSFTACNIAAFAAVGPLVGDTSSRSGRLTRTVKPLGWIAAGMIVVSGLYGALVGVLGTRMPQFSAVRTPGISPRIVQAMVTFGTIGVVMLVLGLASLGVIADPLARVSRRLTNAPLVLMGALIGGFLIGRPYPLFRDLFRHAAATHNPLYGATAFVLQSVGNIAVMAVVFLALTYGTRGLLQRWLAERPARATILIATTFILVGAFLVLYWDVRILGRLGYLWWPTAPWNG